MLQRMKLISRLWIQVWNIMIAWRQYFYLASVLDIYKYNEVIHE